MKRRLLRITLLLIVGAATTVAVAWACALFQLQIGEPRDIQPLPADLSALREVAAPDIDAAELTADVWSSTGYELLRLWNGANDSVFDNEGVVAERSRAGWPLFAFHGWMRPASPERQHGVILLHRDRNWLPILPVLPIGGGFLVDTLFYAAIWAGLIFGLSAAKRAIRRRRGRCPQCGYDLRGHKDHGQDARATRSGGGCPECGWNRSIASVDSE